MRMTIVGVVATLLVVIFSTSTPASGEANYVTFGLYHPDGNSSVDNLLQCGWHNNCLDGPDGGRALD